MNAPGGPGGAPKGTEAQLRAAIADDQLFIAYQPIGDLTTGAVFAYEALLRSRVPELGSPPMIFETAIEAGMVGELGRHLRDLAVVGCPDHALFLNVHPLELAERWLVQPDDPTFEHTAEVYLEITESVPLGEWERCLAITSEIRDRGVHLVVDDLGAGYSNLKYIADLHPRIVKLDRALIINLATTGRTFRLVKAIVGLCHELDARVVAEGIETVAELTAVRAAGVDLVQGYLLGRPHAEVRTIDWPTSIGLPQRAGTRSNRPSLGRALTAPVAPMVENNSRRRNKRTTSSDR